MRAIARLVLLLSLGVPVAVQAQYIYANNSDGTVAIIGYTGAGGALTITNTINGLLVTSIGNYAFDGCTSLTGVTIPDSVSSIGVGAFQDCTSLTNAVIGTSVANIGVGAFEGCTSLTGVTIPNGVANFGNYAFHYCTNLTAAYFLGNAPPDNGNAFLSDSAVSVYYMPGTTNWGTTFGGAPTVLWNPHPQADADFGVSTNVFGFTISGSSNLVIVTEACTNLVSSAWSTLGTNLLTGGSSYFSDPTWTNYPWRFYRFRSP